MEPNELAKRLHISLKPEDGTELTVPCAYFFKGSTYCDRLPVKEDRLEGFSYKEEWSNGYREVYINESERAVFTYCEGDLDLTVDHDDPAFYDRLHAAEEFYAKSN